MVMRIYGAAATNVERALLPLFEAEVSSSVSQALTILSVGKSVNRCASYLTAYKLSWNSRNINHTPSL